MTQRERIDTLLVSLGLAESRTRAQAMVMSGTVLVDERRIEKPSERISSDANIRIKGAADELRYVSRGGLKLEAALREFAIDPAGCVALDVGSSTGGFTDCLLQHGASHVTAIDAGTNQMVWSLRSDARVEVRERTNARELRPTDFATQFDIAVMDVSFISAKKVMPAIVPLMRPTAAMIILIKPQFEVGRSEIGKGGIVRDAEKHERVVREVNEFAASLRLIPVGVIASPILGAEGNKEFLALYRIGGANDARSV